jgi:hypothetical protein
MKLSNWLLLFSLLTSSVLSAQEVEWVKSFSSPQRDAFWEVKTDADGNILVLGFHTDTLEIDGIQVPHHGDVGQQDFFLAKLDPAGNVLWVNAYTGPGFDRAQQIALDPDGNIYLGCLFSSTLNIAGTNLTSMGVTDALIIKLDSDGNFQFARRYGGLNGEICYGISHDGTHLIATGHYGNGANFDGNTLSSNGNTDMWVAKLNDADGSVVEIKTYGGTEGDRLYQVIPVENGEYIAVGYFSTSVQLTPTITIGSGGGFDALLLRLDSNLDVIDYRQGAGTGTSDQVSKVWNGPDGSYHLSGHFAGTINFSDTLFSNSISSDGFMLSYDSNHDFQWGTSADTDVFGIIAGGTFDEEGQLYLTGTIGDGDYFGLNSNQSFAESAVFVGRFNSETGAVERFVTYDGPGASYSSDVASYGDNLYLGLIYENTINIDGQLWESGGDDDALLVKLKADQLPDPFINSTQKVTPQLPVTYWHQDGQTLNLWTQAETTAQWQIFNVQGLPVVQGQLSGKESINIQDWAAGIYYLRLAYPEGAQTLTLAIIR